MAGALLLPAAMQNDPSDATGNDSAGLPEERRSRLPHIPLGSWFVSEIIPAAPNAREELRYRLPNTQPRITTPHSATLPVPSARRTALSGRLYGDKLVQLEWVWRLKCASPEANHTSG